MHCMTLNSVTRDITEYKYMCHIKLFNTNFHYVFLKVKMNLYINCKIPLSYLQHI